MHPRLTVRRFRRALWLAAAALIAGSALAALWAIAARPAAAPPRFIGREACIRCHQDQYRDWQGSHHDLAMDHATDQTVLGNFDDALFTQFGVTSHFYRDGQRFMVHTEGPNGEMEHYEVKYTFGVEPLQQYLIEFPGGRLQPLGIAWDTRPAGEGGQRWFHLYPDERIEPDDPLHWTSRVQNWNRMCASCHSTNLRKGYEPQTDSYRTTWSEIDVSCEACHGPGSRHVAWAEGGRLSRLFIDGRYGLTTDLKSNYPIGVPAKGASAPPADGQIQSCFLCHARRNEVYPGYVHGEPYLDHYTPQLLREELYFPDGQIQDEVYVHGSYVQSRMYHKGVACSDCHDPHTLRLRAPGNALCIRCHEPGGYDTPDHHHHEAGTAGASCVACHMPARTYMVVDPRRDHSFSIPRPDLSAALGTPNACSACHTDHDAPWAAEQVQRWYGPDRPDPPSFAPTLAAAREGEADALDGLIVLAGDPQRPAIVRATAADLLGRYAEPGAMRAMLAAAEDNDPLVRLAALPGLRALGPEELLRAAGPLLEDPIRSVRVEAARVLSVVSPDLLGAERAAAFDTALQQYIEGQRAQTDLPTGHMNLANLYDNLGRTEEAIEHYRAAIEKGDYFIPARMNLATLYNRLGRNDAAEPLLRRVIELDGDYGEAHYSLGLLLAEDRVRLSEAARHLGRAAELLPERARVHYNYGLALQHLGQRDAAAAVLRRAHELDGDSPDIVHALAVFHLQEGDLERAHEYARRLVRLVPEAPGARQLLEQVQQRILLGE